MASSTFREGKDGNYDPKAPPKGDLEEKSNRDNFRVPPAPPVPIVSSPSFVGRRSR